MGMASEEIELPPDVQTVSALIEWLRRRSEKHRIALEDVSVVRVAVNQEFARLTKELNNGDEVAFFPPVTGG